MLDERQLGEFIDQRFTSTLFRLETLDNYDVADEDDDFHRYLIGRAEPTSTWPNVIRDEVARGLHTYRVHVLRSPLSEYLRYECEWAYLPNTEAGEHIRILDTAEQRKPQLVPDHDFWLVGDEHLVVMHYYPDGTFRGANVAPAEWIPHYAAARDAAWSAGIEFTDYWAVHPQYHRAAQAFV
jgi:hypothetical protein